MQLCPEPLCLSILEAVSADSHLNGPELRVGARGIEGCRGSAGLIRSPKGRQTAIQAGRTGELVLNVLNKH